MTTILSVTLPQVDFALTETLSSVPDATFEIEEIVETGEESVLPLLWAGADDHDRLDAALRADPTTEDVELLSDQGERWLYRMEWVDYIHLLVRILVTNEATVLEAATADDKWVLRVMYPTHDGVEDTKSYCEEHNISLEIRAIREMESTPSGRYGLTDAQYEALTTAYNRGYYAVPREVELDEVAAELAISHQALSERLRRAIEALTQETLLVHEPPPEVDTDD